METVTSFDAEKIPAEELAVILADYCALERLRDRRREVLPPIGVLVLVAAVLGGVGFLSATEWVGTVVVLLVAGAWPCLLEVHGDRKFTRHLEQVPGSVTHVRKS